MLVVPVRIGWALFDQCLEDFPLFSDTIILIFKTLVILRYKGVESSHQRGDFLFATFIYAFPVHSAVYRYLDNYISTI